MELHTDDPKVAAIQVAWRMTEVQIGPSINRDDPEAVRAEYTRNYKAIMEALYSVEQTQTEAKVARVRVG